MSSTYQYLKRKSMPSQDVIYEYWKDKIELYEDVKCCFACGKTGTLHRAHIFPCNSEKDNLVTNIHLLCKGCHNLTEGVSTLSIDLYWEMVKRRPYWMSDLLSMFADMPFEKLKIIEKQLYDSTR